MAEIIVGAGHGHAQIGLVARHAERAGGEVLGEGGRSTRQRHAVLRALRAGERRLDGREVEAERVGEDRVGRGRVAPHALRLAVGAHELDAVLVAAGEPQVVERGLVDGEEAAGRAVFGRHVGDRRAVGERQVGEARAVELHELADHALLAEHLRDREHEVRRGDSLAQLAVQAEADDVGDEHRDRLAEHRRLRLDAAHAPAQHAEAVDHRGVAVGAVAAVGVGVGVARIRHRPDDLREVFEVHLVADAGTRRHHAEIVERRLAPAEELVALAVALELDVHVLLQRVAARAHIHHHRVVDHQINRHQRVDALRLAAEAGDAVAHRGEIDHRGHASEILHEDARGAERHLGLALSVVREPGRERLRVGHRVGAAILEAQDILEQHLQAVGQAGHVADRPGGFRDREVVVGLAVHDELATRLEAVLPDHPHSLGVPGWLSERPLYRMQRAAGPFGRTLTGGRVC
jgi:hypothetical protein